MNLSSIIGWLQQPSSVNGIATLIGGAAGAAAQHFTHDPAAALSLFAAIKGAVGIMLPDNTAAQNDVVTLSRDTATAMIEGKMRGSIQTLALEGLKVFQDVASAPPSPPSSAA